MEVKIRILIIGLLSISFLALRPDYASALTVSPVKSELVVGPGESAELEIILHNDQKESKIFYFDFQSFESRDESGNPVLFKSRSGLPTWMSSAQESIILGAGQEKIEKIRITVPRDAEPGGYFAAVLLRNDPPKLTDDEGVVGIASQVGSLVLLRVAGDLQEGANILEFNTKSRKRIFKSLPVDFYYRFQNGGDTWSKPLGDIAIENLWGGTSKLIPANPEGGNVLPMSIRRMEPSWLTRKGDVEVSGSERLSMPDGFWKRVMFEWYNAPVGRYTARLTLSFGAGNQLHDSKEFVFWILPWELLSVAVPSGIFTLVILRFGVKRYNHYIINRDKARRRVRKISKS